MPLDIRRIGSIKKGEEVIGTEDTRVKVVKNKVAPPFKSAEFEILYDHGISREGELLELGVKHGIVSKSGTWFNYGRERVGQGKDNAREYLIQHPEIAKEIEGKVRALALPKSLEGREAASAREAEPEAAVNEA